MDTRIKYNPAFSLDDITEEEQNELGTDLGALSSLEPDGESVKNARYLNVGIIYQEIEIVPRRGGSWRYIVGYYSDQFDNPLGETTYSREDAKELK